MEESAKIEKPVSAELSAYRTHLRELVNKSQESFEKQLSYISAGSLSISIGFIKNVVGDLKQASNEGFLILAWGLMGVTLLINLMSHIFTSNCHNKTIGEIDDECYDYTQALCRHNNIKKLNYISVATLILGITFLLVFISLNI
ncbi:MAG TPA: hypothetical protein VGN63_19060 [Flavisolibacter sp.]|jgi:hypothetical protein|nr:hypothetical protein [Flavisolibacter sp.]